MLNIKVYMQDILPALPMVARKLCNLAYITNIYVIIIYVFWSFNYVSSVQVCILRNHKLCCKCMQTVFSYNQGWSTIRVQLSLVTV